MRHLRGRGGKRDESDPWRERRRRRDKRAPVAIKPTMAPPAVAYGSRSSGGGIIALLKEGYKKTPLRLKVRFLGRAPTGDADGHEARSTDRFPLTPPKNTNPIIARSSSTSSCCTPSRRGASRCVILVCVRRAKAKRNNCKSETN